MSSNGEEDSLLDKSTALLKSSCYVIQSFVQEFLQGVIELCGTIKDFICIFITSTKEFIIIIKQQSRNKQKQEKKVVLKKSFKERIEHVWPALQICTSREMKVANEYMAKGMGLMAGYEGRQARFNVFHLRGGSPAGVRVEVWSDVGPIPIERRVQLDRLEVTFVPPMPGAYTVLLTSLGRPLPGSPYTVKVDEACFAPPFSSPFSSPRHLTSPRRITSPGKKTIGIIDFGDEEMMVKEDGSLMPLNRSRRFESQKPTLQEATRDKLTSLENQEIKNTSKVDQPITPTKNRNSCELLKPLDLPKSPLIKPIRCPEPKRLSHENLASFQMSNYVTRQESIETLKCSRNIQKLITKFEAPVQDVEANQNVASSKKYNKDWTFPPKEESSVSVNSTTSVGRDDARARFFSNRTDLDVIDEVTTRPPLCDSKTLKNKNTKLNRSHSLSVYLERIAALLTPPTGDNQAESKNVDDVRINGDNADYGTKVSRSTSWHTTTARHRNVQECGVKNYKNFLSAAGDTKDGSHIVINNAVLKGENKIQKMVNKVTGPIPFTPRNTNQEFDFFSSNELLDNVEFRVSASQTLENHELWPDRDSSSNLLNNVEPRLIKAESLGNLRRNLTNQKVEMEKTFPPGAMRKIKTMGNIYSPPITNLTPVLEIADDRETSSSTPKPHSFIDDFDALALSRHQPDLIKNSTCKNDNVPVSEPRKPRESSPPSRLSYISAKTSDVFKSSFDSSSSRDEELLNDITEPNFSGDITLSSSDSDNLSLDHDDAASPILDGDQFQKVPTPCMRRSSIQAFFDQHGNHIESRTNGLMNQMDISIISHIQDNNTNLRREWTISNPESSPTEFPPFALEARHQEESKSMFSGMNMAKSVPEYISSEDPVSLDSRLRSEHGQSSSSFMSLDLCRVGNSVSDVAKIESVPLNNSKTVNSTQSRTRSSLSLDEKKMIFCKFNKFCSNIGLKKYSHGSFTVARNNGSVKKSESDKLSKFKLNRTKGSKKIKELNQKPNNNMKGSSSYHVFHAVKCASDVNFVGRMKDYWNNINRCHSEKNKDKPARAGSVTSKTVTKNRDRFERMSKAMDKLMNKAENNESRKVSPRKEKTDKSTSTTHINDRRDNSIVNASISDSKPWKLSDFIDKTPRSPFASRRRNTKQFASADNLNRFEIHKNESLYQLRNLDSINSELRSSKKEIALVVDPKQRRCSETYKIGKFDKMINKDALIASLRSFDTESAYSKTFYETDNKNSNGYDMQYPHIPIKPKKEFRSKSPFSYKITPFKIFQHTK